MRPKHTIQDDIDMTDDGYQFDKDSPQSKPAAAETPAPKCPAWYDMNSCKECSGKICGGKGKPAAEKKKLCTCGQEDHEGHYCPPVEVRSRDDKVDMEKASEIQADVLHDDEYHGTHYKDRIAELHVQIDRQAKQLEAKDEGIIAIRLALSKALWCPALERARELIRQALKGNS